MIKDSEFLKFVMSAKNNFEKIKNKIKIVIIANEEDTEEDFLINQSMDSLVQLSNNHGITFDFFMSENDFMEHYLNGKLIANSSKHIFIYNRSIAGPWGARRILIPAFCKFNGINFMGNNAYLMGLLCNKPHYLSILKDNNIPIAETWTYDFRFGWLNTPPSIGMKVIIKLGYESDSAELSDNSVFIYSGNNENIHHLSEKHSQPVVLQKFIEGYEVTIPIFNSQNKTYAPMVLGELQNGNKRLGELIMGYEQKKNSLRLNKHQKYYNFSDVNQHIIPSIKKDCKRIVNILGITNFSRFDLRIDDSFEYYFNDLGSIPGILPECSFAYVYEKHGFTFEDFLISTIYSDIINIT